MANHGVKVGVGWRFKPDLSTQQVTEITSLLRKDAADDCVKVKTIWDGNTLAGYHFTYSVELEISEELSLYEAVQDWRRVTKASLRQTFKGDFID